MNILADSGFGCLIAGLIIVFVVAALGSSGKSVHVYHHNGCAFFFVGLLAGIIYGGIKLVSLFI